MSSSGKICLTFIFVSLFQFSFGQHFWMNLQKIYQTYQFNNGTSLGNTTFNIQAIDSINVTGPCLMFKAEYSYTPDVDTNSSAPLSVSLCEQQATFNNLTGNYTCPCEWFFFGNFCYQFQQHSPLLCSALTTDPCTTGGKLAEEHSNVFNHWLSICNLHPAVSTCPFGFIPYPYLCISEMKPPMNWHDAEKTCTSQVGEQQCVDPYCNHLPSFTTDPYTDQLYPIFKVAMSSVICNPSDIWLGYNSYAFNNFTTAYGSTSYLIPADILINPLNGTGTCVAYNVTSQVMYLDDCTQPKAFTCLQKKDPGMCPSGWIYITPYCYKLLENGTMTYDQGVNECVNQYDKSAIASFHSQAEWDAFNAYRIAAVNLKDMNGDQSFDNIYVGYRTTNSNEWAYEDATDPTYAYWNPSSEITGSASQCAVSMRSSQYYWEPSDCETLRGIVCKGPTNKVCDDPTYYYLDGKCYKYMTNISATTWPAAAQICNDVGATLPIFSPDLDLYNADWTNWQTFQKWRLSFTNPRLDNIWIGLTQYATANFSYNPFIWMNPIFSNDYKDIAKYFNYTFTSTDPYVVSSKTNGYVWSLVNSTSTAYVICQLKKNIANCLSNDWFAVPDLYSYQSSDTLSVYIPPSYTCYRPLLNQTSFGAAEDFCQSFSNLTFIVDYANNNTYNTWKINDYLNFHYLFMAMQYPLDNAWIGYSRGPQIQNGPWIATQLWNKDVYGSNTGIWDSGQPNGSTTDQNNYCAFHKHNKSISRRVWTWRDTQCTNQMGAVCYTSSYNGSTFCPADYLEFTSSGSVICYKLYNKTDTYANASAVCINDGGYLPSFHSPDEYEDFLRFRWIDTNLGHSSIGSAVWIGLQDSTQQPLSWKWSDSSNYNWAAWDSGRQPVNSYQPNCVYSFFNQTNRDTMPWATDDCSRKHLYICQKRDQKPVDPCPGLSQAGGKCYKIITTSAPATYKNALDSCRSIGLSLPYFPNSSIWDPFVAWLNNMNQAYHWSTNDVFWPVKEFWIGLHNTNNNYCWEDNTCSNYNNLYNVNAINGGNPDNNCFFATNNSTNNFTWSNPKGGSNPNKCCQDKYIKLTPCKVSVPILGCIAHDIIYQINCFADTKQSIICQNSDLIPSFCPPNYYSYNFNICYSLNATSVSNRSAAQSVCQAQNGSLPSFFSDQEWFDYLSHRSVLADLKLIAITDASWINLDDSVQPLLWQWGNNMNYNYSQWLPNQEPSLNTTNRCVSAANFDGSGIYWHRESCNVVLPAICQIRSLQMSNCPVGWSDVNANGNCYQIFPQVNNVTADQASLFCESIGSTLPYFVSDTDWNAFIGWKDNFGTALNLNIGDIWLGLKLDPISNLWILPNSIQTNYTVWDTGMPNNNNHSYCVATNQTDGYNWVNLDCRTQTLASVICQLNPPRSSPCPAGWLKVANICYKSYNSTSTNSKKAESIKCASESANAFLPSFHSDFEWYNFKLYIWLSTLSYNLATQAGIWIGLDDLAQPLMWQWSDNTNYNWSYWNPGIEPNNNVSQSCVVAVPKGSDFVWQRQSCSASASLICQYRLRPLTSNCTAGWSDVNGDGNCYQIRPEAQNVSFFQALLYCQSFGGVLPCFNNVSDWNNFLYWRSNFGTAFNMNTTDFWIGLTDPDATFLKWSWLDGTIFTTFTNWDSKSSMPQKITADTCVASIESASNQWQNLDCTKTSKASVICKQQTTTSICGSGWFQLGNICYITLPNFQYSPQSKSSSLNMCSKLNGSLPSFHYDGEWNDFLSYLWLAQMRYGMNATDIWIGLDDTSMPQVWQWDDGTNYNWSNWEPGVEPSLMTNQSCVITSRSTNGSYVWRRQSCDATAGFICQRRLNLTISKCQLGWSDVNGDGNCYQIRPEISDVSRDQALLYCQSINGTLPCFYNLSDWTNFLYWRLNFGSALNMNTTNFWIGLTNASATFSSWSWLDNTTPNGFVFWDSSLGMPKNSSTSTCVASYETSSSRWQNTECTDITASVICKEQPCTSPCGYEWFQIGDICYTTISSGSSDTKSNGLNTCTELGGTLPSFHFDGEWNDFVNYIWLAQVRFGMNNTNELWIGLEDTNASLVWEWNDGTNYNWSNWKPGVEPSQLVTQTCAIAALMTTGTYVWMRKLCNSTAGFICQKRIATVISNCSLGWSDVNGDGNCYQIRPDVKNVSFDQALMYCQSLNATLPCFNNVSDWNNFLSWRSNFGTAYNLKTSDFWIGLTNSDSATLTNWSWTDGAVFGSFNEWDQTSNMPVTVSGAACVASIESVSDQWQNSDCSSSRMPSVICKEHNYASPCGPGWFPIGNICYSTLTNGTSDSKSAGLNTCLALGGNLPSFHYDEEWNNFVSYIWLARTRFGLNTTDIWIGLEDTNISLVWQWNDGSNYNWSNWKPKTEPTPKISQSCTITNMSKTSGNYVWHRKDCSSTAGYICQRRLNITTSSCALGWSDVHGDSNCYKIIPNITDVSYEQALLYCHSLNGTLPSFASLSDWNNFQTWRYNFGKAYNLNTTDYWIGLTDRDQSFTNWTWVESGTTTNFTLFDTNNGYPIKNSDNFCVASTELSSNLWSNYDCSFQKMPSLICKEDEISSQCGEGWLEINKVCYTTVVTGATQNRQSSATNCQAIGGILPTFHNENEYDDFNSYIWLSTVRFQLQSSLGVWIGLSDTIQSFIWQWDDSSPFDWNQWEMGVEPSSIVNQTCVISIENNDGQFVWRRQSCQSSASFICQKRLTPSLASICPPGWTEIDGKCLKIWSRITNLNINQISTFCQLNNGSLPTFNSSDTYQNVINWKNNAARGKYYNSSSFFWAPLTQQSGTWSWPDGSPFPFNSDFGSYDQQNQLCVISNETASYNVTSLDCKSTAVTSVICMYGPTNVLPNQCSPPLVQLNDICYQPLNQFQPSGSSSAQTNCQGQNSSLPSFHLQQEWDDFNTLRWYFASLQNPDNNIQSPDVWVGSVDVFGQLIFTNLDNSNFNWLFWLPHVQPINVATPNCVASPSLSTSFGEWITADCSESITAICQYRLVPYPDPCGIPGWSSIGDRCYKIITGPWKADFYLANNTCNYANATLPSFSNEEQWYQFLAWKNNFYLGKGLETDDIWLGASWIDNVTQWQWTDSNETEFDWTNFPDDTIDFDALDSSQCVESNLIPNNSWTLSKCKSTVPSVICQLIQYAVDCQVSQWENWTCTSTCGPATIKTTRKIMQVNLNGGKPCPSKLLDNLNCDQNKPCPIDCQVSGWYGWEDCDCNTQLQTNNRKVLQQDNYGGIPCPVLNMTRPCDDSSCIPMSDLESLIASILSGLGCSILIISCGFTIVACLVFKIFNLERMLHAGQEASLIITHVFVWTLRQYIIERTVCTFAAVVIQLSTLTTFAFLLLEAIQMYTYATNIVDTSNMYDWQCNLALAIMPPVAVTTVSTAVFYHHYYARWSCWLNIGHMVSFLTIVPVVTCAVASIVLLEAAGQGHHAMLPLSDKGKYFSNKVNQRGLLFIIPLNLGAWMLGMMAVYYQRFAIYPVVFGFNIALGVTIFIFHACSHALIYMWLKRVLTKIGIIRATNPKPLLKPDLNKKAVSENVTGVENDPPSPTEKSATNHETNEPIKEDTDSASPNEMPDPSKDMEAYLRWVMDGRHDNMHQCENLLF